MRSNRVMIWRFESAPDELRSLYVGPHNPEWLVLVPKSVRGPDLDEIILGSANHGEVLSYEVADGGVVYIGKLSVQNVSKLLASFAHAATRAGSLPKTY